MPDKNQLTISVPEAGKRYFDLSRGGSYEAAKPRGHTHDPYRATYSSAGACPRADAR